MAWRNVTDDHITWSMLEGSIWTPPLPLYDRRSGGAPALGRTDRGVVMVWIGNTGPTLWWSQLDNGVWSDQQAFTDRHVNLIDLHVSLG